LKGFQKTKGG